MKRTLATIALLAVLALPAAAQFNTNPPPTQTGLTETVVGYFTSFNTNLDTTFSDNRFSLWTGADSIQGGDIPLCNELGLSYDLLRPSPATTGTKTAISAEFVTRNGGVAGSMISDQVGLGFSFIIHDVRATFYADGGWNMITKVRNERIYGEAGLRVWKALGQHFFAGVGMATQFPRQSQLYFANAGATF